VHRAGALDHLLVDLLGTEQAVAAAGYLRVRLAAGGRDEGHGGAVAVVHDQVLGRDAVARCGSLFMN
jgi:hypothetical protein